MTEWTAFGSTVSRSGTSVSGPLGGVSTATPSGRCSAPPTAAPVRRPASSGAAVRGDVQLGVRRDATLRVEGRMVGARTRRLGQPVVQPDYRTGPHGGRTAGDTPGGGLDGRRRLRGRT